MNSSAASSRGRYHIPNLVRALAVLECLGGRPAGLTGAEIAAALKLTKNSVFRITRTLLDHGYLLREEDTRRFVLSRKLLALGYAGVGEQNLVEKALDVMRSLRDATRETVILGTLVGDKGMALEQVPGLHPFHFSVDPGNRLHLHTSAPGKALLAFLPEAERGALLSRMALPRFNRRTITRKDALRREMERIRACGFSVDRAEEFEGVHCVAAPVLNQAGHPVAAIWTTGPSDRVPLRSFDAVGRLVREHARRISRRLGHGLLKGEGR